MVHILWLPKVSKFKYILGKHCDKEISYILYSVLRSLGSIFHIVYSLCHSRTLFLFDRLQSNVLCRRLLHKAEQTMELILLRSSYVTLGPFYSDLS